MSRKFPKNKSSKQKITDRWKGINDGNFLSAAKREKRELAKGAFYVYKFQNWITG